MGEGKRLQIVIGETDTDGGTFADAEYDGRGWRVQWAGRSRRVHQVRVGQFGARHHVIVNGERVRVRYLSA
jgi:hypothetical protein